MAKVVGTVIDKSMKMVAIVVEATYKDFGGIGNIKCTKPVDIKNCADILRKSTNFKMVGGAIVPTGKEKLNELNMFTTDGKIINNKVRIAKRIVDGDDLIGFELEFACGEKRNFRYNDTMRLADWFKPVNFVVRSRKNAEGVAIKHIAGKGVMLDDIPAIYIGDKKPSEKRARTKDRDEGTSNKTDVRKASMVGETNVDILTLFETLGEDSLVIAMDNYVRTTEKKQSVKPGFRPLSSGVVGSASLSHSKDDMKTNVKFKKPGMVGVPGIMEPIIVYTHNDRTILKNGKCHMNRVGIAIHPSNYDSIIQYLRASEGILKLKDLNDENMAMNVKTVTGTMDVNYKFVELDLSGIQMMSKERAVASILPISKIAELTERVESNALILKAIKPVIKDLESKKPQVDTQRVLARFKGYDEATLQKLLDNGVNIYNGEYRASIKLEDLSEDEKKLIKDAPLENDAIHVEYSILPNKVTKLKAVELWQNGTGGELPYVDKAIEKARSLASVADGEKGEAELLKFLNGMKDELDKEVIKLRDIAWMHKLAMLVLNDFKAIHTTDKGVWENQNSKAKGRDVYATQVGSSILKLAVTNTIQVG